MRSCCVRAGANVTLRAVGDKKNKQKERAGSLKFQQLSPFLYSPLCYIPALQDVASLLETRKPFAIAVLGAIRKASDAARKLRAKLLAYPTAQLFGSDTQAGS